MSLHGGPDCRAKWCAAPATEHQPDEAADEAARDEYGLPEERTHYADREGYPERCEQRSQGGFPHREAAETDRHESGDLGQGPDQEPHRQGYSNPQLPAKPRVEENEAALNRERETQSLGGATGIPRQTTQRNQGTTYRPAQSARPAIQPAPQHQGQEDQQQRAAQDQGNRDQVTAHSGRRVKRLARAARSTSPPTMLGRHRLAKRPAP